MAELTRDQILAMQPGPEMDSVILETFFDFRWFQEKDGTRFFRHKVNFFYLAMNKGDGSGVIYFDCMPHPSTDIAAAWGVWDKLVEDERYPTIHCGPTENFDEPIYFMSLVNPPLETTASDAPFAIGKIALLATLAEKKG